MPRTAKQQRAACTAYGMRKRGKKPRAFAKMSMKRLKAWCKGPLHA